MLILACTSSTKALEGKGQKGQCFRSVMTGELKPSGVLCD